MAAIIHLLIYSQESTLLQSLCAALVKKSWGCSSLCSAMYRYSKTCSQSTWSKQGRDGWSRQERMDRKSLIHGVGPAGAQSQSRSQRMMLVTSRRDAATHEVCELQLNTCCTQEKLERGNCWLSRQNWKSSLGKRIKLQMYTFIFREGVFPRICIILAGTQGGGEKVSLCPILSTILKRGAGRRVCLQLISYLSCVYPCRDRQGPETYFTLTASIVRVWHHVHHAAYGASCPKPLSSHIPKRKKNHIPIEIFLPGSLNHPTDNMFVV